MPSECRFCKAQHDDFQVVGDFAFGRRPDQRFYECPSCDVAFLFPPLDEKHEAKFYAQEFEKFMEGRSDPEEHILANQGQVARRMPFLEEELSRSGTRGLEIGCSSGFMLLPLK